MAIRSRPGVVGGLDGSTDAIAEQRLMSSNTSLAQAYYDLSVMIDAGVPILRTLDIVTEGRQGYLKRVLTQIRASIAKGSDLTEALAEHRNVFPELDRMLIEAAETSGSLGTSFKMLSQWYEFVHRITRRMLAGLIYPLFILHAGALIAAVPASVMRGFTPGGFARDVLTPLVYFYVPASIVIACMLLRNQIPPLRCILDAVVLRIPVLGLAVYHMSVCRYARAFHMMYAAGVPMTEVTERATRATGNVMVARLFAGGSESVRNGGLAWEGYSKRLLPQYLHLFQIGEETGELDKTADKVAEIAADRADLLFTEFAKWLPKIIYFAIVGYLAMRVITLWQQVYSGAGVL
ncbi:MAG: type II secretion system F family protein [Sedimentisphaerales bacterium]|nr:type II secretion system F family protein [Sedimentisphaerales bacterium]